MPWYKKLWLILFVAIIAILLLVFVIQFPSRVDRTVSVYLLQSDASKDQVTSFSINGQLYRRGFDLENDRFVGTIGAECIPYTQHKDNWTVETCFLRNEQADYYYGMFFYNSNTLGFGYANGSVLVSEAMDRMVFITDRNDESYVIVAPAESRSEAIAVLADFGIDFS